MSFWGLLVTGAVAAFAIVLGLKLVPVYLDSFKIDKALRGTINDSSVTGQSKEVIVQSLLKRLDIDDAKAVNYTNWKESMTVIKRQNSVTIEVYYQVETPLVGNLSLMATFDKRVDK
jgi:hypothetical protein